MNILITGALGHIGSYFFQKIKELPNVANVYILDANFNNNLNILFNYKINNCYLFIENILKFNFYKNIKKIDYIIHLASHTNAENSLHNKNYYFLNNYNSFKKICEIAKKYNSKLIHVSSTSVYGKSDGIIDENCLKKFLKPQSPYAAIKLKEEEFLRKNNIDYVTLRFGTISGVSFGMRFHTAVNKFCLNAMLGKEIPVWSTALNQLRPYLSLKDAFRVVKYVISQNLFDKGIYNVLTSNLTVRNICDYITKYSNKKIKIKFVNSEIMNQLSYEVSTEKIKKKDFLFTGSIEKDIKETINLLSNFK
jgi:nucleoside-diphosphate-sugar epimerase